MINAFCSGPCPCLFPPIKISPPPWSPLTSNVAGELTLIFFPNTFIVPPLSTEFFPEASSDPETVTPPSSADRIITPSFSSTDRACAMPETLTTLSKIFSAAFAVISIFPPSAIMVPELLTAFFNELPF